MTALQLTRRFLASLATYVPGGRQLTDRRTGGSASARYCYCIWLRHLALAWESGLPVEPRIVAELGPGDSLGAGLAAVLSGTDRYFALDIVPFSDTARNLEVLENLVRLFDTRTPVPEGEFGSPPVLASPAFPTSVLPDQRLDHSLDRTRLEAVRRAVEAPGTEHDGIRIDYAPNWLDTGGTPAERPGMIFSQAVLEHVDDLSETYRRLYDWLAPDGFMSHEIDFTSHGFARTWDGHWTYSNLTWRAIRGRRHFGINRQPLSSHLAALREARFRIVAVRRVDATPTVHSSELAAGFRSLGQEDRSTSSAIIQAVRDSS